MSGEAEKAECPDGDIDFKSENELEHSNTDQNRNRIDAGTVDEVIELHLDDDQLSQSPDNHSNEEMQQPPKRAKTKGGLINRPGCVCTCGGLHFGNYGHVNQAGGGCGGHVIIGCACGTGAGRACSAGHAGIGGHSRCCTDDGLDL